MNAMCGQFVRNPSLTVCCPLFLSSTTAVHWGMEVNLVKAQMLLNALVRTVKARKAGGVDGRL